MLNKAEISAGYNVRTIEKNQRAFDDHKPASNVAINGTVRKGSIGQAIKHHLFTQGIGVVDVSAFDVTQVIPEYHFNIADALVVCSSVVSMGWFTDAEPAAMANVININLTGALRIAQTFARATIDRPRRKRIIFIGSMAYNHVLNGSLAYCAAKAGLAHAAKCMAFELAPFGFDVFSVHPSNTEKTPMAADTIDGLMAYRGLTRHQADDYWASGNQRGNVFLGGQDIAEVVAFLLSGKASFLSGCNLELAGGNR